MALGATIADADDVIVVVLVAGDDAADAPYYDCLVDKSDSYDHDLGLDMCHVHDYIVNKTKAHGISVEA